MLVGARAAQDLQGLHTRAHTCTQTVSSLGAFGVWRGTVVAEARPHHAAAMAAEARPHRVLAGQRSRARGGGHLRCRPAPAGWSRGWAAGLRMAYPKQAEQRGLLSRAACWHAQPASPLPWPAPRAAAGQRLERTAPGVSLSCRRVVAQANHAYAVACLSCATTLSTQLLQRARLPEATCRSRHTAGQGHMPAQDAQLRLRPANTCLDNCCRPCRAHAP